MGEFFRWQEDMNFMVLNASINNAVKKGTIQRIKAYFKA